MASSHSFDKILEKWCLKTNPKRILEWGPGYSTQLMRKSCPNAEIFSIEHQKEYADKWTHIFFLDDKVKIILREEDETGHMDSYVNPPVEGKFDLIFIDGRNRLLCLKKSKELLSENGVVILHDSERPQYKEGIQLYYMVDVEYGTVALK